MSNLPNIAGVYQARPRPQEMFGEVPLQNAAQMGNIFGMAPKAAQQLQGLGEGPSPPGLQMMPWSVALDADPYGQKQQPPGGGPTQQAALNVPMTPLGSGVINPYQQPSAPPQQISGFGTGGNMYQQLANGFPGGVRA